MGKLEQLIITPELNTLKARVQGLINEQLVLNEQKGFPETSGIIKNRFAEGLRKAGKSELEINFLVFNLQ
ncbi:MAG: hypothetical protein FWC26_06610 [Fibromonadales bacterium]|nr:hypothetical protein [Fibromonadales bacterium]